MKTRIKNDFFTNTHLYNIINTEFNGTKKYAKLRTFDY